METTKEVLKNPTTSNQHSREEFHQLCQATVKSCESMLTIVTEIDSTLPDMKDSCNRMNATLERMIAMLRGTSEDEAPETLQEGEKTAVEGMTEETVWSQERLENGCGAGAGLPEEYLRLAKL